MMTKEELRREYEYTNRVNEFLKKLFEQIKDSNARMPLEGSGITEKEIEELMKETKAENHAIYDMLKEQITEDDNDDYLDKYWIKD